MLRFALFVLISVISASLVASTNLICGAASANFPACPRCLAEMLTSEDISFFWNWNTMVTTRNDLWSSAEQKLVNQSFIPMVWGNALPDSDDFLKQASYLMLFNEPDLYGPWCCNSPEIYGCAPNQYSAATSSGWAPLFSPGVGTPSDPHSAQWVQWVLGNLTLSPNAQPTTKIVSPSMANDAKETFDCENIDPSEPANPKRCQGWLAQYKEAALNLSCKAFDGTTTNCWDVFDHLQIHAYAHSAQDVLSKVDAYGQVFAEDFAGTNNRKKKTLWITELAAGSENETEVITFIEQLFDPVNGFNNREKYSYLSHVSWFSDFSFPAFPIGNVTPHQYEVWTSSLFQAGSPTGQLSNIGQAFVQHCNNKNN